MRRQILQSGLMVVALRLGGAVLGIFVTIVLSRSVGAAGLGYYAYAVTLITLAAIPVSNGWGTLLMRSTSRGFGSGDWAESRGIADATWKLALAVSVAALLAGLAWFRTSASPDTAVVPEIIVLIAATLFFEQLSANRVAVIRGFRMAQIAQLTDMVARPAFILSGLVLVGFLAAGTVTLVQVFRILAVASLLNLLLGQFVLWKVRPPLYQTTVPAPFRRDWLQSAGYLAGSAGLVVVNAYVDILILGFFVTAEEIGHYRVAAQVGILAGLGYTALNFIAAPRFASHGQSDDMKQLGAEAVFYARIAFLAALPAPLILWFHGEALIRAVFGPQFEAALTPMILLCILQVVSAGCGMAPSILTAKGHESAVFKLSLLFFFVAVAFGVIGTYHFGIDGAALAVLLSGSLWRISMWRSAVAKLGLDTSMFGRN